MNSVPVVWENRLYEIIFSFSVLSPMLGMPCCCCKAPYRFRHAALTELRDFLVAEKKAGRFHPLFLGASNERPFHDALQYQRMSVVENSYDAMVRRNHAIGDDIREK